MRRPSLSRAQASAVVLIAFLFTVPASAQGGAEAPSYAQYAGAVAASTEALEAVMAEGNIPGITVAVSVDGEIVWAEGFGYADLEHRVPAWPHTKMRVGSVAKAMTAAAVGLLVEQGRLDLDAPVQRYVPSFPEKRWPISTRQVAGHIAGIRHYRGAEMVSSRRYLSVKEGLSIFAEDTLLFEPGTDYQYSSYGWNLVSAVVEGAAGEDFLPYMYANVFRPLGMRHTVADHTDSLIVHRSGYYVRAADGKLLNAPYVDNSYKWAGGGFLSTAEDLVRFGHGMLTAGILTPETVDVLFTSQAKRSGEATGYGIGVFVGTDDQGRRTVGHGGGSIGGTTAFTMYPDHGVVVAVIANLSSARFDGAHVKVADAFIRAAGK